MFRTSDDGASNLRSQLRPVARRLLTRAPKLEQALVRLAKRPGTFEQTPSAQAGQPAQVAGEAGAHGGPDKTNSGDKAQSQRAKIFADFFQTLNFEGDLDRAMVAMTRRLLERAETNRARISLQVFARYDQLRPVADICLALCAYAEGLPVPAWKLFTASDLTLVLKWAPDEYFELAFRTDPAVATESLSRVLYGDVPLDADPHVWLQIAYYSFSAGVHELVAPTLDRADAAIRTVTDASRLTRLERRSANLRVWLDQASQAAEPIELPPGEIAFALVGYRHPELLASADLDDVGETLAVAGHLARHNGVEFTGDDGLVAAIERLRPEMPKRIDGPKQKVRLYEVEQDVSRYARVPNGTWTVVSEWFDRPLAGDRYDLPIDPRLRPIFISFHITPGELAAPGAVDYLRAHAPIGCRDWDSVFLLHSAGVPAFFSGALAATADVVVGSRPTTSSGPTVLIDVPDSDASGEARSQIRPSIRDNDLGSNLALAAGELRNLRDVGAQIVTSSVRCYVAARAVGCQAELRPQDLGNHRVIDFVNLDDAAFRSMQQGITDKLTAVFAAILADETSDEVYALWARECAPDVARAEAEMARFQGDPELSFDLAHACAVIRSASVVIERSRPAQGDGTEVNVEFSVDQNYKHQLEIVLDSIVQRTERPVRAFILCRGFGQDDFQRLATLFPTVSFVWLPTADVDYGPIPDKIKWATIVTMDRTMLPEMLPEVDRIIHFDLDALCLADLGELFDVDMEGTAIAAVDSPQPVYLGGLETFRRTARRLRREGQADVARELIIRTHTQHAFDFEVFNAGIMVLDLAKMRADGVVRRYLGYIRRYGVNGQVIMNIYVGRDRKKVSADWNRLVRLEIADRPKVAHWAGPVKPWHGHQYAPGREWWQEQEDHFAAQTASVTQVS